MLYFAFLLLGVNAQTNRSSLFGTWAVEQYNYSCAANADGQRFGGHRPVEFNTVSFTNWDGAFRVVTASWVTMSGVFSNNGSFHASGTVGVNVNDTNARGCALTSRITGVFNASEGTWVASLQMSYSALCWGCFLDEDGCPSTRTLPLSSSTFLSPPAPRSAPALLLPPPYLAELMTEWPVAVSRRCGRLTLGVTAVEFSNVNFTRITVTATTSLGKLALRGRYEANNTFLATSSFTFTLGAVCTAVAQISGQVQFYENSSCAEENNRTLSWSANASMLILGNCANCSQIIFPLESEPLSDCLTNTTFETTTANTTSAVVGIGARDLNLSVAPTSVAPSQVPSPTIVDSSWRGIVDISPPDSSFIAGIPMWAAILIIVLVFLCCLGLCGCLFFRNRTKPPPHKVVGVPEREQLVTVAR